MRALALHPDVLLVSSALLQVNCVIVRGGVDGDSGGVALSVKLSGGVRTADVSADAPYSHGIAGESGAETFVIDSPVLPDELDALPALIERAGFPAPSGLLATHGDWDHLLGRLAFPDTALGVAESTAERLAGSPGDAQRQLRTFDEELMIERTRPLALGALQALPVPGRCELGDRELELHPTAGHTVDGLAVMIGWAGVLVTGDYLSRIELPTLGEEGGLGAYLDTLECLRALVPRAQRIVPGHGPMLDTEQALVVLGEDVAYLRALAERGAEAELPERRRSKAQRTLHERNAERIKP